MRRKKQNNKKTSFSKGLLVQETILIWIVTLASVGISAYCVFKNYTVQLDWLATVVALPWAAYGVSQACYYKKSEKENTKGGIVYETAMKEKAASKQEDLVDEDGYSG